MKSTISNKTVKAEVLSVRPLTDATTIIRFERNDIEFAAGQYLSLGLEGFRENREYSIYSGPGDAFFEVLIKTIPDGTLSPHLSAVKLGDYLRVAGPFGHFTINNDDLNRRFLFIATGTGIAPFNCFNSAYPEIDFHLLHGVSAIAEQYDHERYGERYISCISREVGGGFHGRVTEYLKGQPVEPDTLCYLCGNCDMIYDAFDILIAKGVHPDNLHAEVYF